MEEITDYGWFGSLNNSTRAPMAWHDGSKSALEWFNDDKDNNDEDCDHERYRSVTEAGQRSRFLAERGSSEAPGEKAIHRRQQQNQGELRY